MAKGFVRNFETTVLRRDGTEFTALISWTLMEDTDGNPTGIINVARDISERKQAEEALRASEERLKILFKKAPDAYYLNDLEGNFVDGNEFAEKITGYRRSELIGKSLFDINMLTPEELSKAAGELAKSGQGRSTGPEEFTLIRKDGGRVPVEIRTYPVKIKDQRLVLCIARDITERKQAEMMRLRYIERVISAQDEERRRIARELHDETGQWIGSLVAGLSALEVSTSDENARKYAKDLRHMTSMTLREIQRMSRGLHPSLLDSMGLAAAIERCAAEFSTAHGISVKTEVLGLDGENRLSDVLETTIYRVVQEALTNVAKHACATTTSVFIVRQPSIVRVVVEDDGQGFEPDSALDVCTGGKEGLGLISIRERVELFHGSMRLESSPGEGTTVAIEIPLGVNEP
jgi:PAS domain S-box-containing protein